MEFHAKSIAQVLKALQVNSQTGLSKWQVQKGKQIYGANTLSQAGIKIGGLRIFFSQWKSPLILILLFAGIISWLLNERLDATIILVTAGINAVVGFFQEYKANKALNRLQTMVTFQALVLRGGKKITVSSEDLVPGDIVYVRPGDKIPADGRLLHEKGLEVNEAPLTGESEPTKKVTCTVASSAAIGDRKNMLYRGTSVVNGTGTMVVVGIGKETELGRIATLVGETTDDQTPLQKQLKALGNMIGIIVIVIALLLFILGTFFRGGEYDILVLFETAVAVAVAAIPEGMVISLTVILAIGMQHIFKRHALVRRLVSAETLGSVSVICTDKTGTLTEGLMTLSKVVTADGLVESMNMASNKNQAGINAKAVMRIAVLANDGILLNPEEPKELWQWYGDTTDTAIIRAGFEMDLRKQEMEAAHSRVGELFFSSERKYIATLHEMEHGRELMVKGAPEVILRLSHHFAEGSQAKHMSEKKREEFESVASALADEGFRTLAVGYKRWDQPGTTVRAADVNGIVFVGILALADPLRAGVKETMTLAKKAGIRVIMITGDHAKTASFVAKQLGLPSAKKHIISGDQLEHMSDDELKRTIGSLHIFARVNPEHKIRIVRALQENGEVVAMTGDGVNDAPALKASDIGVAVGSGTDVARETSDMVLLDDSFITIVAAVEEGRRMYQNIRKVVLYLLSGSLAEVILISGSLLAGLPLAMLPAQILWVNIIEDSFPNMALAFERGDKENMSEPPRKKSEPLINMEMKAMIASISIISNLVLLALFFYFMRTTGDLALTRTLMFVGLGIDSLLYVYSVRSFRYRIWQMNPFENSYLTGACVIGWSLLLAAVYLPGLQTLLRTVPLGVNHWVIMILFGLLNVCLIELVKGLFLKHINRTV